MPQLTTVKTKSKSTIKMPPKSVALIMGRASLTNQLKQISAVCYEITRLGHTLLISDINREIHSVITSAHPSKGKVVGFFPSEEKVKSCENLFSKISISNTNYSQNMSIMLKNSDAAIIVLDTEEELKYITQPIKNKILIGILASLHDESRQLLDISSNAGIAEENYMLDSSPTALVSRIIKRLRHNQLTSLE